MVYDRKHGDRELTFEASGALMDASLVMRDRETDSWWSIMTSSAIGGELEGSDLIEMPLGEKSTWRDWVTRHPDTLVLSIEGREHDPRNPYADYFAGDETFRGMEVEDDRLPPKEPIYSFRLGGRPYAVAHASFAGGRLFELPAGAGRILLYRPSGAPIFTSSRAWVLEGPGEQADRRPSETPAELLARAEAGALAGARPVAGFDTFWYNWVAVNRDTELLP